jgi:diadenosine tetraphosphate (Ap4A) HIT family hydrolase
LLKSCSSFARTAFSGHFSSCEKENDRGGQVHLRGGWEVFPWPRIMKEKGLNQEVISNNRRDAAPHVVEAMQVLNSGKAVGEKGPMLVCPVCEKANTTSVKDCTYCGFPLTKEDLRLVSLNPFLDVLAGRGKNIIRYKDAEICVFDDKFPISDNHVQVIPVEPIADITHLGEGHLRLLKRMYECGLQVLTKREISPIFRQHDPAFFLITGFNYPVSVFHLHLHMVLLPLYHLGGFKYPRFHPFHKVLKDLQTYGRVRPYFQYPNEEEGKSTSEWLEKQNAKIRKLLTSNES